MIRGTKRTVQPAASLRASIHNRFDVEVRDAATGALRQRARGYNVICDTLWSDCFSNTSISSYMRNIAYGTGSGTPSAADTTLFTPLGSAATTDMSTTVDVLTGVAASTGKITLSPETAVGETLTEVGIGTTAKIFTHAMLEDMNGNPISIEKTDTDVIIIYATVYLHWSATGWDGKALAPSDVTGMNMLSVMLAGAQIDHQQLQIWAKFAGYRGAARRYGESQTWMTTLTWSAATKKYSFSGRAGVDEQNLPIRDVALLLGTPSISAGGIYSTLWLSALLGSWFTPPAITGEAIATGDGATADFRTAFPVRSGATVYVNGVAAAATVRSGPPDASDLAPWLNALDSASTLAHLICLGSIATSSDSSAYLRYTDAGNIFENPDRAAVGIASFVLRYTGSGTRQSKIETSDDLVTWTEAVTTPTTSSSQQTAEIPAAQQGARFFRLTNLGTSSSYIQSAVGNVANPATNIHFDAPPAAGAVITASYVPDCIAKDSNHVFDLTVELQLGEFSEG